MSIACRVLTTDIIRHFSGDESFMDFDHGYSINRDGTELNENDQHEGVDDARNKPGSSRL